MSSEKRLDIALFCDAPMLRGLQVTLYSALESWEARHPPTFWLFHDRVSSTQLERIDRSLQGIGRSFNLHPVQFSVSRFRELRSLHGNFMPYGRICLPELLPNVDRVLYLDCDLVVGRDLSELLEMELDASGVGAVAPGPVKESLDWDFYRDLGLEAMTPCLNSGVLLLDIEICRRRGIVGEALAFARLHRGRLKAADQTVLNGILKGRFRALPGDCNFALYPSSPKLRNAHGIVAHFVGSPKPFDPMGGLFHRNAELFFSIRSRIPKELRLNGEWRSPRKTVRLARLVRSYWRSRGVAMSRGRS